MCHYSEVAAWDTNDLLMWLSKNDLNEFRKPFYSNAFTGMQLFKINLPDFLVCTGLI